MKNTENQVTTFSFKTSQDAGLLYTEHKSHDIRTVMIDGDPWFVADDLCEPLGFTKANLRYHRKHNLGKDEGALVTLTTLGGPQKCAAVSESGLYKIIMRSDKPQAKAFQDWVTKDVLPAIRKDGAYVMGEEKVASGELSEDEFILRAVTMLQGKVDRLKLEKEQAEAQRDVAEAHRDAIASTVGQHMHKLDRFCRSLHGVNLTKVKESLLKAKILYKKGGVYNVYRKYEGAFDLRFIEYTGRMDIFVTEEGKKVLTKLYAEGRLIMKSGCRPVTTDEMWLAA